MLGQPCLVGLVLDCELGEALLGPDLGAEVHDHPLDLLEIDGERGPLVSKRFPSEVKSSSLLLPASHEGNEGCAGGGGSGVGAGGDLRDPKVGIAEG